MKLTREANREAVRHYDHVGRAPVLGGDPCDARCSGVRHRCTREAGHTGPHVAHGLLGRVLVVWDGDPRAGLPAPRHEPHRGARRKGRRPRIPMRPTKPGKPLPVWERLLSDPHLVETATLVILGVGMVLAGLDWILRIMGAR
ncbi:MAG: hypothetical protein AMXMBFR53_20240 [Gemmatimonadota bacterium]